MGFRGKCSLYRQGTSVCLSGGGVQGLPAHRQGGLRVFSHPRSWEGATVNPSLLVLCSGSGEASPQRSHCLWWLEGAGI